MRGGERRGEEGRGEGGEAIQPKVGLTDPNPLAPPNTNCKKEPTVVALHR